MGWIGALTQDKFGVKITKLITDALTNIAKFFKDTWDNVKNGFSDMWDGMKHLAGDGINAVIAIPNTGIDGINGLIQDFGGPKNAISKIPKVKFAMVQVYSAHTETQLLDQHLLH